jgi:hypothetical protein
MPRYGESRKIPDHHPLKEFYDRQKDKTWLADNFMRIMETLESVRKVTLQRICDNGDLLFTSDDEDLLCNLYFCFKLGNSYGRSDIIESLPLWKKYWNAKGIKQDYSTLSELELQTLCEKDLDSYLEIFIINQDFIRKIIDYLLTTRNISPVDYLLPFTKLDDWPTLAITILEKCYMQEKSRNEYKITDFLLNVPEVLKHVQDSLNTSYPYMNKKYVPFKFSKPYKSYNYRS